MRLGFLAEIIAKRRRVGIHVDEHEAAESFDAHLRQRQVLEIDVREIPVAQRFLVRTVEVPGPAMERAFEFRSEEHTSELQSLMRISYAVFCLKKKNHSHKQ